MSHSSDDSHRVPEPPRGTLSRCFEQPACCVPIVHLPDEERLWYGADESIGTALLHDADALRVGRLDVEVEDSDLDTVAWWLGPDAGEDAAWAQAVGGRITIHLPLILARGRGAWVFECCRRNVQRAAAEAMESRVWLVARLCELFDWTPETVPLGATVLVLERDVAPYEPLALPARDVVGCSDLWRLAERLRTIPVGPCERRDGRTEPQVVERLFGDLATLGAFARGDWMNAPLGLPGWMLRRAA